MSTLASVLPKPKQSLKTSKWAVEPEAPVKAKKAGPPPYLKRQDYLPQDIKDFGDGGAFPEIHIIQYPLGMGKIKDIGKESTEALPLQTDKDGNIKFDLVLRHGSHAGKKVIHSSYNDMTEQDIGGVVLQPDEEIVQESTEKTRLALEKVIDGKIKSGKPKTFQEERNGPQYVKYVPAEQHTSSSAVAKSRIVKLVEAPVDPMEPPKFKHRKIPRSTGSPPPPVLRSPPRKVSVEEQKNWVIPPCISNWKNAKGYTIPLDKRLANDGRGLQDITVNENFAKFSQALFIADKHAREEVKLRSEMQAKLAQKQKKDKEDELRRLAQKAREEHAGFVSAAIEEETEDEEESEEELSPEERQRLRERDELRREKAKEREKQNRMSHMGKAAKERDISEKIALGVAQPTASKESMYDQRLFNQSSGMNSGFEGSDSYALYDKPLFNSAQSQSIYRPKKLDNEMADGIEAEKINSLLSKPHKGFSGADATEAVRTGPVQFEKEADVFGTDAFMSNAKRGRDREDNNPNKKTRGE
ncbi:Puff-specific protein Bx42 [Boothiomyces sp. JEL0866]|nr:Puff-specific protein Bx42 [Boothiomyces sp. JEL0866]